MHFTGSPISFHGRASHGQTVKPCLHLQGLQPCLHLQGLQPCLYLQGSSHAALSTFARSPALSTFAFVCVIPDGIIILQPPYSVPSRSRRSNSATHHPLSPSSCLAPAKVSSGGLAASSTTHRSMSALAADNPLAVSVYIFTDASGIDSRHIPPRPQRLVVHVYSS